MTSPPLSLTLWLPAQLCSLERTSRLCLTHPCSQSVLVSSPSRSPPYSSPVHPSCPLSWPSSMTSAVLLHSEPHLARIGKGPGRSLGPASLQRPSEGGSLPVPSFRQQAPNDVEEVVLATPSWGDVVNSNGGAVEVNDTVRGFPVRGLRLAVSAVS